VKLSVRRNGEMRTLTATLQNRSGETALLSREDVDIVAALGGQFATASERICRQLDIRGGVEVRSVKHGGLLERARIKEGFVITHINDKPVYGVEDLERLRDKITSIDGIYPNGRASSYMIVQ
jgi:S1-C subfamily serine protease